jgi:hypothetical protein
MNSLATSSLSSRVNALTKYALACLIKIGLGGSAFLTARLGVGALLFRLETLWISRRDARSSSSSMRAVGSDVFSVALAVRADAGCAR